MITFGKTACSIAVFALVASFCSTSSAHMSFRKHMQTKYPGMKVSCNACHVKGKPKTERTEFGKLFAKRLKESNPTITADFKSKKGADRKKYEADVMVPAFDKVLKVVKTLKNDKGEVYDDLIKSEQIAEIKKDPNYKPEGSGKKD